MASGGLEGRENLRASVRAVTKEANELQHELAQTIAKVVSDAGAKEIQNTIEATESALRPGKQGRRLSSKMFNLVGGEVKRTGTTYTARSGWLGEKERYFYIQEHGGVGYGIYKGQPIWGMNALLDARREMEATAVRFGLKLE